MIDDFVLWVVINYEYLLMFISFVLLPLVLISYIIQRIWDKIKKQKRINGLILHEYSIRCLLHDSELSNKTLKQKISDIIHTYYKINNRYWR